MAIASSSTDGNLMIITARPITGRYCSSKCIIFLDRSFPIGLARRQATAACYCGPGFYERLSPT